MDNDKQGQFEDHIVRNYQLLEFKGKGAYGVVWKALDKQTKQIVALKKVFDAFHNQTDSQRTFREVIFLEQVSKHNNIIKLLKVIKALNNKDLYMVFEFMETDLHKVIRANILEPIHKKYVIYQLLKAVKFLHSGDIIHRDLKPANLLINADCLVKLADFGLARTVNSTEDDAPILTEYVATRWYRAPEILLGSQRYSKAVDMWSIGCILGEMILGKAIFPGTSTMNQVEMILDLLGTPSDEDVLAIQAPLAQHILDNFPDMAPKNLKQLFHKESEDTLDFLKKLLVFNPNKRLTIAEAMNHPYMREFCGTEVENTIDYQIETVMNDNVKYSIDEYMAALYNHISPKKSVVPQQKSIHSKTPTQANTPKAKQMFFSKKAVDSSEPSTNNSENKEKMKEMERKEIQERQHQLEKQLQEKQHIEKVNEKNKILHHPEIRKQYQKSLNTNEKVSSTMEKFKQIESMIKLQKAKMVKNENIVLQPSKSTYGNKSMNITRAESSKKKEASCEILVQSPINQQKSKGQQFFNKMSTREQQQQLLQGGQQQKQSSQYHKSSQLKQDSKHVVSEKFLNKKSYLQYILSGQAKLKQ